MFNFLCKYTFAWIRRVDSGNLLEKCCVCPQKVVACFLKLFSTFVWFHLTSDLAGMIQAILNVTVSYKPPPDGGSKETGKIVTVGEDEEDEGNIPWHFPPSPCQKKSYFSQWKKRVNTTNSIGNLMKNNRFALRHHYLWSLGSRGVPWLGEGLCMPPPS